MATVQKTKMTLTQLRSSRKLWRSREVYRYKKYLAHTGALKSKWKADYLKAREQRVLRDRQIAVKRKGSAHTMSDAGVALVAEFEGFRANAYRDPVGVLTQGYGETEGVTPGRSWTKSYALKRLRQRLDRDYVPSVLAATKGKGDQNAVDGFGSFVYNVGTGGVSSSTTVGRLLRAGKIRAASDAILSWCKAGGRVLPGLLRRRRAERALIRRSN